VHASKFIGRITNVLYLSPLSHDRYQYDSLIVSKQTWVYPRQHLQQLLWCQRRWRGADVMKECLETNFHLSSTLLRKLCVHYSNGFDKVESVCFFYSNPVSVCGGVTITSLLPMQWSYVWLNKFQLIILGFRIHENHSTRQVLSEGYPLTTSYFCIQNLIKIQIH
jgi:hypothetical protein